MDRGRGEPVTRENDREVQNVIKMHLIFVPCNVISDTMGLDADRLQNSRKVYIVPSAMYSKISSVCPSVCGKHDCGRTQRATDLKICT